jgi:hypothetical protein
MNFVFISLLLASHWLIISNIKYVFFSEGSLAYNVLPQRDGSVTAQAQLRW